MLLTPPAKQGDTGGTLTLSLLCETHLCHALALFRYPLGHSSFQTEVCFASEGTSPLETEENLLQL